MWSFWDKMHQPSNLNEILPVSYFEGANFTFDIRFLWFLAAQYPGYTHQFNFLRFATYLEKVFSFFSKVSKHYGPSCYFFERAYCKYDIEKNLSIF